MPMYTLHEIAPSCPTKPQTAYECTRNFLMDSLGYLGEIKAIKASEPPLHPILRLACPEPLVNLGINYVEGLRSGELIR